MSSAIPSAIDFYFDFSSPYGYFASTRIESLARDLGREARWHPILLGPMFKASGTAPLVQIPTKGAYAVHDMQRTADLHDIPYRLPDPFPIATVATARLMLHLTAQDPELAKAYARQALRAYYVDNTPIGDADRALDIAAALGVDRHQAARAIASDAIKQQLRQANEEALRRGVFGSPFVFVDDEPFWGFDRFDTIRLWAARKASA